MFWLANTVSNQILMNFQGLITNLGTILGSHLAQNDATGWSSNCPSTNVDIHEEHVTNASILESKLRHVLYSMVDEHEEIPLEHCVVPFVVVDGSNIFKSTLVS